MRLFKRGICRFLSVFERSKYSKFKKASQDFNKADNLYFSLFQNSTIGLYQTTPEGKILSANPAMIKMLDFDSLEDLLSRDLSQGSYIEDRKREEFMSFLENNDVITDYESEWYTKHGKVVYVKEGARAVRDKNGQIFRYDGTVENITNLKKAELELIKAKQKAEENDRLKSAFLANMSHEIRTPLNGILGFSELLLEKDLSLENRTRYINTIHKSGDRLLDTINDIIDISKIESGQMPMHLEDVNVIELISDLYLFFLPQCNEKGIILNSKDCDITTDLILKTDKSKLNSILTNLIKNAIKYTTEGEIRVSCKQKDELIEFFVSDTGIGIPHEKHKSIFNRFEQVDIYDKRSFQGSGLGLTITKAYVEMLKGKIWLESEEGKGSTFYFTLPYPIN